MIELHDFRNEVMYVLSVYIIVVFGTSKEQKEKGLLSVVHLMNGTTIYCKESPELVNNMIRGY